MRNRYLLLFILGIFFSTYSSCTQRKVQKISYFIPKGYVGWVAIVFNVDSSSNTIFSKENEVSYIINGQPCFFTIRNGIPPEGLYDVSYYYYDKKDTIKLIDGGRYCQVSITANAKFTKADNVLELAGQGFNPPDVAVFDINAKYGVGGGISFDGETFGASVGFGIGASVSAIFDNRFVFAFSLKDVAKYENAAYGITKAKEKGYSVKYSTSVDDNGFTNVNATIEKTMKSGRIKTKSYTLLSLKQHENKNAVYTKYVKGIEE